MLKWKNRKARVSYHKEWESKGKNPFFIDVSAEVSKKDKYHYVTPNWDGTVTTLWNHELSFQRMPDEFWNIDEWMIDLTPVPFELWKDAINAAKKQLTFYHHSHYAHKRLEEVLSDLVKYPSMSPQREKLINMSAHDIIRKFYDPEYVDIH
jgi:hypothetical protein